jgi:hypothetical protein
MAADIEKAVIATQLYMGSEGLSVRIQDRFYQRMQRAIQSLAKKRELTLQHAHDEITREAARRGQIRPKPGKDY